MSRSLAAGMASILGALLLLGGLVILSAEGAVAASDGVCEGLDSGKIDTNGDPETVTVTAPDGFLIDQYCVKAGSEKNGNGPEIVDVDPPVAEITISHSSGKAVSHYSVSYVPIPDDDPSPTCTPDDQYNPCEEPTPLPFDGFGEPTPPTCETAGTYSLPSFEGITFSIDPAFTGPGTYTVTATLNDPENTTFPDGTTEPKSATITVEGPLGFQSDNPEEPCFTEPTPTPTPSTPPGDLLPGDIAAECVSNIPYLSYAVDLPEGFEADSDTPLTITFVNPDGEDYVVTNQPLSGQILWPGASVNPDNWPGWELLPDGKTYVETDGNFAWTRAGVDVLFEVNPSFATHVSYPPASSICNGPVQVLPTEASSPGGTPTPGATVLPTSVDAGLSSIGAAESGRSPWGPALVASGLAMLVLALGLMVVRRPRGSHGF